MAADFLLMHQKPSSSNHVVLALKESSMELNKLVKCLLIVLIGKYEKCQIETENISLPTTLTKSSLLIVGKRMSENASAPNFLRRFSGVTSMLAALQVHVAHSRT